MVTESVSGSRRVASSTDSQGDEGLGTGVGRREGRRGPRVSGPVVS